MGKKGDLLRQMKKDKTVYTFTRAQLVEHDKQVLQSHRENLKIKIAQELDEEMRKMNRQVFWNLLPYVLSMACKVLVEHFNWTPLPKTRYFNKKHRLAKFSDYLVDEVNVLFGADMLDVQKYSEDVYEKYGVKFMMGDLDENN